MKKQPQILFVSMDEVHDRAVEEQDPYAVMWAKVQEVAQVLDISEREAQQIVLGRIVATSAQ